jgi:hypothetical protein
MQQKSLLILSPARAGGSIIYQNICSFLGGDFDISNPEEAIYSNGLFSDPAMRESAIDSLRREIIASSLYDKRTIIGPVREISGCQSAVDYLLSGLDGEAHTIVLLLTRHPFDLILSMYHARHLHAWADKLDHNSLISYFKSLRDEEKTFLANINASHLLKARHGERPFFMFIRYEDYVAEACYQLACLANKLEYSKGSFGDSHFYQSFLRPGISNLSHHRSGAPYGWRSESNPLITDAWATISEHPAIQSYSTHFDYSLSHELAASEQCAKSGLPRLMEQSAISDALMTLAAENHRRIQDLSVQHSALRDADTRLQKVESLLERTVKALESVRSNVLEIKRISQNK